MIRLEFTKKTACPWTLAKIEQVFKEIAKVTKKSGAVELNIIADAEMKSLNFRYRGLNKTTDVLSFAWQEEKKVKSDSFGQIYISYPQIVRQAKKFGVTSQEEFVRMLAHGFLHIIGHDHIHKKEAGVMFDLQETIVANYFKN